MKAYLLVLVLATLCFGGACTKHNDAQIVQEEAVTLVKYNQPKLETLDSRVQAIFKRGSSIPGNLPGIEDVGRRLQEARDTIVQLRGIIGSGPEGKSAVEKQAEALAKQNKVVELQKLAHDTESMLERGMTVINDDLYEVEAWIANYDRKTLALNTAVAAAPDPNAQPTPPPPEAVNTPQPGPPAAQQQAGSAAPAAPAQPKQPPKQ